MFFSLILACTGKSADTASSVVPPEEPSSACAEQAPKCLSELTDSLGLQAEVSPGAVETTTDAADFITMVDATAGGYQSYASNPWVYLRFTPTGAEKVELTDLEALESSAWDAAFRRFVIRLNGGNSGPGCVGAQLLDGMTYDAVTSIPEDVYFSVDEYFTAECELITDDSGFSDGPVTALGAWWEYPESCVATTGHPFLVQVGDGSVLKLVVEGYYQSGQEDCNSSGTMGSGSANITLRWQLLD